MVMSGFSTFSLKKRNLPDPRWKFRCSKIGCEAVDEIVEDIVLSQKCTYLSATLYNKCVISKGLGQLSEDFAEMCHQIAS